MKKIDVYDQEHPVAPLPKQIEKMDSGDTYNNDTYNNAKENNPQTNQYSTEQTYNNGPEAPVSNAHYEVV